MDEMDAITARANECRNIIEQTRDIDEARACGAMTPEEYTAAKGRRIACLRVLAACERGEEVTDEAFAQMIEAACAEAALPTQEEQNTADIAYLLMLGGEE